MVEKEKVGEVEVGEVVSKVIAVLVLVLVLVIVLVGIST